MNGALSVTGTMSMASGTLDLNGALTVGAIGSLALGGATHTVARRLTVTGGLTASGTLVFDGALERDRSLDGARFRTSRSRRARARHSRSYGNVTVNGNLTQTSGHVQVSGISGTFTITVSGNAQFQGGALVAVLSSASSTSRAT